MIQHRRIKRYYAVEKGPPFISVLATRLRRPLMSRPHPGLQEAKKAYMTETTDSTKSNLRSRSSPSLTTFRMKSLRSSSSFIPKTDTMEI
ncbi:hypothetical protein FRC14_000633, partial [Serendipita sp. 396]